MWPCKGAAGKGRGGSERGQRQEERGQLTCVHGPQAALPGQLQPPVVRAPAPHPRTLRTLGTVYVLPWEVVTLKASLA